nr:piggyBac transposable element-derived protein 4-like [Hydra vulgaris]
MIRIIVNCTNAESRRIRLEGWVDTTVNELHEFIGVLLLAGVFHSKNQTIKELWSKLNGIPIFSTSMQRDRFVNLRRCIRFDERETRNQRRFEDKFAPLRNIMEMFTTKCKNNYNPSAYLTVDEQLVTFRGRCPFKMFIPTKPGKYGMKIWILCDAETSYCINLQPYIGRVNGVRDVGQGTRVVLELTDHLNGSGRHITAENFFTNIHLARALLGRKMTYTGTIKKNKGEIPKKLLPAIHRPVYSSIFSFQNDSTIFSYVPKKNKAVILLSTFQYSNDIVMDHNEKPCIILDYNKYKGGVDTLDQIYSSDETLALIINGDIPKSTYQLLRNGAKKTAVTYILYIMELTKLTFRSKAGFDGATGYSAYKQKWYDVTVEFEKRFKKKKETVSKQ